MLRRWCATGTRSPRTARSTSASTTSWPTTSRSPRQVYELAGEELTDEARDAMAAYLDGHQRGRLGTVATSPEMFGQERVDLEERFAPYVERFLT